MGTLSLKERLLDFSAASSAGTTHSSLLNRRRMARRHIRPVARSSDLLRLTLDLLRHLRLVFHREM